MSQAPNYTPVVSFATEETNQAAGRSTVRTTAVDAEFANISSSINAINTNLKLLQRDDGKLLEGVVETFALSEATRALIASRGNPRGEWQPSTFYSPGDVVQNGIVAYLCFTGHISSLVFSAQGFWITISGDGSSLVNAQAAAASATVALASENAAELAETNAELAETNAETAATNAANSATDAGNSATAAALSATSSSNSASSANASALNAAASATFLQSGTGAVSRTTQNKLREEVSVLDFGADSTGVADASTAFQSAMDSLGANGGIVDIGNGKYLISSTISIPVNVTLIGRWKNPELVGNSAVPAYQDAGSALRLGVGVTINLGKGAGIENVLIYRSGMTFPVVSTAAYAGTALTATNSGVVVRNVMVIGFNKLFVSANQQRHVLDRVYGDNNNGIEISGSPDVEKISNCHMWPFATDTLTYPNPNTLRTGIAYYLHDRADWAKLTNCFSYAYAVGFKLENVNSCTLLSCSADSDFPVTNTALIGFDLRGTSTDIQLIGCQAAAQGTGYRALVTAGNSIRMTSCNAWSNATHNILVSGGDVTITGGISRSSAYAVSLDNAVSRVFVNGVRMSAISTRPFLTNVATTKLFIGANNDYGDYPAGTIITDANATVQTIASADPVNIPPSGDAFMITGTTAFGSLSRGYPGRQVTLIFAGALTVGHSVAGTPSAMKLAGNVNFTTAANSTLTLRHNGVQWYEIGRAA